MEKQKEYSNGEITVVWKPGLCIHSTNCVKGAPTVFKPSEKPWVQMESSDIENIVNTIHSCPSGALTYYRNDGVAKKETSATSEEIKIEVIPNGPLLVFGTLSVNHADGSKEIKENQTAFCRCGKSMNQPYCDGTHKK